MQATLTVIPKLFRLPTSNKVIPTNIVCHFLSSLPKAIYLRLTYATPGFGFLDEFCSCILFAGF